jgi:ribulose kinase
MRTDTAAVGAAMIAAVAAGLVPDLATAASSAPPASEPYLPLASDAYAAPYERYRRLVGQLAPLAESPWYVDPLPPDR